MTISRILHVIGWMGVAAITVLSLLPGEARPQVHPFVVTQWEHFTAYFFTAAPLAQGKTNRRHQLLIGLFLTALAAVLEVSQVWVPGRHARVFDWLAGTLGAWAGIASITILLAAQAGMRRSSRCDRGLGRGPERFTN